MGAGIAGSYMGYLVQRAFVGKAAGESKLKATHTRAARKMRDEMQALRGPLMKVGQMLSLQTNVLPEETLAELAKLLIARNVSACSSPKVERRIARHSR